MPPVVAKPSPYAASYTFTWLSASGTACLFAAILAAIVAGLKPAQFTKVLGQTAQATGAGGTDARGGAGPGVS